MVEESGRQATAAETYASPKDVTKAPTLQEARDAVRDAANAQKGKVASRLSGVAEALHETAKTLERQNASVGRYADLAAQQVDRVSQALKERGVEQLMEDAEDFARNQPMLFVGGALAAGFFLARVAKSAESPALRSTARGVEGDAKDLVGTAAAAAQAAAERVVRGSEREEAAAEAKGAAAGRQSGAEPVRSGEPSTGGLR